jgi:alkylation response protein AidB-like acyl-CoA dehydrogenase
VDFDDTAEEAAFRSKARCWLEQHAPARTGRPASPIAATDPEAERRAIDEAKRWQRLCHEGGWAGITWPTEHGGGGGTAAMQVVWAEEAARFELPGNVFAQGIGMAGPTIIAFGTPAQQARFLRPMLRGDEIWCQLFSEPGAGSDLAALTTRAEPDGDSYVVNGQKVWTSSAHFSDWGILLARTDPHAAKHKGITYFLDMRSPGVDIRPLRQMTGASHFNEVFLTDVRIPADHVVGPVNDGWRVAMTTLTSERTFMGTTSSGLGAFDLLARAARTGGTATDPVTRQGLAEAYTRTRLLEYLGWRVQTALSQHRDPGPESSVLKLALCRHLAASADLAMAIEGPAGTLLDYGAAPSDATAAFLGQWAARLGGGTEQIQANIVAERVLGLPREPKVA